MFNNIVYQFSSTAIEKGYNNVADDEIIKHIEELDTFLDIAEKSWKFYSKLNGIPEIKFRLVSGYRCKELNQFLNGSEYSSHLKGYAADITIKEMVYWKDYVKWAEGFAKECVSKNILFDEIIIERSGSLNWIHFSIKDFNGNQIMKSYETDKDNINRIRSIIYGNHGEPIYRPLTKNPMIAELKHYEDNVEIEGWSGMNEMDLSVMPGAYMRCIYIMKRLMKSFSFSVEQSAGIVGNLLYETEGRLGTSIVTKNGAGVCQWNVSKQLKYRRLFLNDSKIETGNLINQTSFLVSEICEYKLYEKILKMKRLNDVCNYFFRKYIHRNENVDLSLLETKKECSLRRAYSSAALEIYNNYIDKYKDEWKVGYYQGNGIDDDFSIQKMDDTKLWNSGAKEKINNIFQKFFMFNNIFEDDVENYNL